MLVWRYVAVVPQKSTRGRVTPQIQSSILGTAAVSCTGICSSQPWATHLPGPGGQFLDLFTPCGSQPTVEHHLPYLEVFGLKKTKTKQRKWEGATTGRGSSSLLYPWLLTTSPTMLQGRGRHGYFVGPNSVLRTPFL